MIKSAPRGIALPMLAVLLTTGLTGAPAQAAEGHQQIPNSTFENGYAPWWATEPLAPDTGDGRLCTDVPGGTANPWDAIIGLNDIELDEGETYEFAVWASGSIPVTVRAYVQGPVDPWPQYLTTAPRLGPDGENFRFTFTSPVTRDDAQIVFQIGGSEAPWRFCMDDVTLTGGAEPEVYVPDTGPRVRVNQVAYLPKGPKWGTLVTEAVTPLPWRLKNAAGKVVKSGTTTPRGVDASSGQNVHTIDFSAYTKAGEDYTLSADGETSRPFDIGEAAYERLRLDALKFYLPQRSGIAIDDELRPGYGRPAGHVGVAPNQGDTSVTCRPGVCDYSLDVSGGWYDASDQGKYTVNGGITVATLLGQFERTKNAASAEAAKLGDGALALPESGNGVPDILDEARWEQEFLLKMQVPDGKPDAGMAHHKIHDDGWTGIPMLPHLDPRPRILFPVSTAATLNLAGTAAQAARVFAPYDAAFAAKNLAAAEKAWKAAKANPAIYAPPGDSEGGGPYNDNDVTDEFYWAAAELFLTTGKKEYRDFVLASPHHTADVWREEGIDWYSRAGLARIQLATVPNDLPGRAAVRASVLAGADKYLGPLHNHPYNTSYNPADNLYDWGSSGIVLNNLLVLGAAYDISGDRKYQQAVIRGMDYLLGRNALNISYITGYGEVHAKNQQHRWFAHQYDPSLPHPPAGTVAGGPNSAIQDPYAQEKLRGCIAQFCYIDHIESWSTNDPAINWNAALAWVASFVADQNDGSAAAPGTCQVTYTEHGDWGSGFTSQVTIKNTGSEPINGWKLKWSFTGGQKVTPFWLADIEQEGATVTATNLSHNAKIMPGASVTFGFNGANPFGANPSPELFTLNGEVCA